MTTREQCQFVLSKRKEKKMYRIFAYAPKLKDNHPDLVKEYINGLDGNPITWETKEQAEKEVSLFEWNGKPKNFTWEIEKAE